MRELPMEAASPGLSPQELSRRIRTDRSREMAYRRTIVGVSLVGMASMALVSLFQTGIVKRLPEPPTRRPRFDTEKVNSSKEAYSYGMPDGPLTLGLHAANLAIAAAGPPERYQDRPWLPLTATVISEPIREVWTPDQRFGASRLSMRRIMARRTKAAALQVWRS